MRGACAVVVAALLLAACASSLVRPFRPGAVPGEIIHEDSGFTFPARIGSFARVSGFQYDASGRDISIGYDGDIPSMVTVYVYPAGNHDFESVLVSQSAQVLIAHPGARVTGRRTVHVTPAGVSAEAVSFSFSGNFQGRQQPLHSELVLARHGERFVKYRITYPAAVADLAGDDSSKFLQRFAWP